MMPMPAIMRQQLTRHQSRIELVARYLMGQGLVQLFNVLTGFLLLRWLSIDEQAKYTFAFSLQAGMSILADLGFSGCIVALVGEHITNKERVGTYIATAKHYRLRFLLLSFIVGSVALPFITDKQAWDWQTQLALLVPILTTIYLQGSVSLYTAPLQMHRQLTDLYNTQAIQAVLRLVCCSFLYAIGTLDVYAVLWVYNLALWYTAVTYRRKAARFMVDSPAIDSEARKAVLAYLKPLIPSLIFNAFYGQISIFIMAFYGKQSDLAGLGALARLNQLFLLLNTFNSVVLAPYMARQPTERLPKAYGMALLGGVAAACLMNLLVWSYPDGFIWLLGNRYTSLDSELKLYMFNQSLIYIGSVFWSIHAARNWIFGINAWIYIAGLTIIQVYIVKVYDLTNLHNVILTSLISTSFVLLLHLATGIAGWLKEHNSKILF